MFKVSTRILVDFYSFAMTVMNVSLHTQVSLLDGNLMPLIFPESIFLLTIAFNTSSTIRKG